MNDNHFLPFQIYSCDANQDLHDPYQSPWVDPGRTSDCRSAPRHWFQPLGPRLPCSCWRSWPWCRSPACPSAPCAWILTQREEAKRKEENGLMKESKPAAGSLAHRLFASTSGPCNIAAASFPFCDKGRAESTGVGLTFRDEPASSGRDEHVELEGCGRMRRRVQLRRPAFEEQRGNFHKLFTHYSKNKWIVDNLGEYRLLLRAHLSPGTPLWCAPPPPAGAQLWEESTAAGGYLPETQGQLMKVCFWKRTKYSQWRVNMKKKKHALDVTLVDY